MRGREGDRVDLPRGHVHQQHAVDVVRVRVLEQLAAGGSAGEAGSLAAGLDLGQVAPAVLADPFRRFSAAKARIAQV